MHESVKESEVLPALLRQKTITKEVLLPASGQLHLASSVYMGNSTETVAFQVYEILKINQEFLQFF